MSLRVVSLNSLMNRLQLVLGPGSPLAADFEQAFAERDADRVAAAMEALRSCPPALQREVENAVLDWLFSTDDASGLADLQIECQTIH